MGGGRVIVGCGGMEGRGGGGSGRWTGEVRWKVGIFGSGEVSEDVSSIFGSGRPRRVHQ
jgi:hypothetical protein